MSEQLPGLTRLTRTIQAGTSEEWTNQRGNFIEVRTAGTPIKVEVDGGKPFELEEGEGEPIRLREKLVIHSTVTQSVTVAVGFLDRPPILRPATIGTVNATATFVTPNQPNGIAVVTVPAGGSAQLAAANSDRKSLRLTVASDAIGAVLLAGSTQAAAGVGGLLEPGVVDYVPSEGIIEAYNPNGSDVDVYVLELNRV